MLACSLEQIDANAANAVKRLASTLVHGSPEQAVAALASALEEADTRAARAEAQTMMGSGLKLELLLKQKELTQSMKQSFLAAPTAAGPEDKVDYEVCTVAYAMVMQ